MWANLLTVVPMGLVLGLIAFGRYGDREPHPTRRGAGAVAVSAVVLGPVAITVLGLFGWLLLVAIVVAALMMVAMLRPPRTPLRG